MDAKEKLLLGIEERLTVYANWVNQGGGIRSEGAEYLYCDLLNEAFDYELKNMNRIRDNFPAIDLGDEGEGLAVQVTSTGDAGKVKKTLERFYDHNLNVGYNRLIVLIAGKAECRSTKTPHPGLDLEIWGTTELIGQLRGLSMKKLKAVDAFLRERVDAPKMREPVLHLPVPERRNPVGFLGRKAELAWIGEELKKGTKPVIVAGLGGVGKTALAVEFRKGWAGNVYFATFRESFQRTLADSVGQAIPVQERRGLNEEQTAELALGYLSRCEAGDLLIVDNAEVTGKKWCDLTADPFYEKLRCLPMNVLMTTRHRDTGGKWLGKLAQEELREIFRRHEVNIPEGEMDRLIDAVDGHTMTVDMIARTIRESWGDVTAEDILIAMANSTLHEGDFDEIETDHDQEHRQIYAHLKALFDLSGISDDGKYALRCATLLPQNGMDEALFRHALTEIAAKEIKLLEKKGWVDRKEGNVTIHPVVRLVCRTELKPTEENCEEFLFGIKKQYDKKQYDHIKFRQMAEVFEHASNILEDKTGFWAGEAGYLWHELAETQRALACNLRFVQMCEQHQPDSNNLAASYNNVGSTYGALGDHKQALEYQMKALEIWERVLPPDHPDLALSYDNVGSTYGALGDHKQALEYQLKALEIRERVLPPEHPDLASSYNNVGYTYGDLGDHKQELEYQLKDLAICERVLPPDHPDLAISYNNVGATYGALGDHEKELEYNLKALGIRERVLPGNHPSLALSCSNIAITYYDLGRIGEAATHMRRAADIINCSTLPETHPHRVNYNKWAGVLKREYEMQQKILSQTRERGVDPFGVDRR